MLIEIGRHPNTFAGPGFSLGRLDRNYLDDGFVLLHNYYLFSEHGPLHQLGEARLCFSQIKLRHGQSYDYLNLTRGLWRGLQAAASRLVSMPGASRANPTFAVRPI